MKRTLLSLSAIALVSALAYATYFQFTINAHAASAPSHGQSSLVWLDQEFKLSPDEFSAIKTSHTTHLPKCQQASVKLLAARKRLTDWPASQPPTAPELLAAHQEVLNLERECFELAVTHIFEVGAQMNSTEGARYLNLMLKKLMALEGREHLPVNQLLENSL